MPNLIAADQTAGAYAREIHQPVKQGSSHPAFMVTQGHRN